MNWEFPYFDRLLLAPLFTDYMVFQQHQPLPVRGLAVPGAKITAVLTCGDRRLSGEGAADDSGRFTIILPPQEASIREWTLQCDSGGRQCTVRHILCGEVYLAAGQSNMHFAVRFMRYSRELLAGATNPLIRGCIVEPPGPGQNRVRSRRPLFGSPLRWRRGDDPAAVEELSAVAYSFARNLFERLGGGTPVAFIQASDGGVRLETYLTWPQIESLPALLAIMREENRSGEGDNWGAHGMENYNEATGMFNERLAPIMHTPLRGVLWYQGEGNLDSARHCAAYVQAYDVFFRALGRYFNPGGAPLPVVTVDLAPYHHEGNPLALPLFWEAQGDIEAAHSLLIRRVPIYDIDPVYRIGVSEEIMPSHPIHPMDKYPIGRRMARAVMDLIYAGDLYKPPRYSHFERDENRLLIHFDTDGKLGTRDGAPPRGFAVCGADRVFRPARARIVDDRTVEVKSGDVAEPEAATYAFFNLNHSCNLCSEDGLPAFPFRSDRLKSIYACI